MTKSVSDTDADQKSDTNSDPIDYDTAGSMSQLEAPMKKIMKTSNGKSPRKSSSNSPVDSSYLSNKSVTVRKQLNFNSPGEESEEDDESCMDESSLKKQLALGQL